MHISCFLGLFCTVGLLGVNFCIFFACVFFLIFFFGAFVFEIYCILSISLVCVGYLGFLGYFF